MISTEALAGLAAMAAPEAKAKGAKAEAKVVTVALGIPRGQEAQVALGVPEEPGERVERAATAAKAEAQAPSPSFTAAINPSPRSKRTLPTVFPEVPAGLADSAGLAAMVVQEGGVVSPAPLCKQTASQDPTAPLACPAPLVPQAAAAPPEPPPTSKSFPPVREVDSVLNPTHPIRGTQGAAYQRLLAFGLEGDPGKAWQPEALPKRVYQTLIAATTEVPDESAPRRRPSLFTDGTKAGYSFQTQIHPPIASSPPSLRVLVEPGGTGLDLPGQIDFALATLGKLLQILAWQRLAADINRTARLAFPEDPSQLSHWWGGIWLGAEMGVEDTDLRIYLNLRSGQSTQRWQRVADILAPYAPKALEPSFLALAEQTVRCAGIPVGLAMVLRQGGLGGIRLYVGLDHPTPATVAAAMPPGTGSPGQLKERMDHLVKTFGAFEYNAVTVSYDFPIRDGVMLPGVARFKADVGCSSYLESAPRQFHAWLNEDLGPCASHRLDVFRQRMDRAFGGSQVDYLSFGFRKGGAIERTCYLQPSGLAPRDF